MKKPDIRNLEELKKRFDQMKAENDRIRMEFFRSIFSHPDLGSKHLLKKIEDFGPPDIVVIPASMEGRIYDSFGQYCQVSVHPWIGDNQMFFLWKQQNLPAIQKLSRDAWFSIEN